MCGIAGVSLRRTVNESDVQSVQQMVNALSHRGPDDSRIKSYERTVLGSSRLSIVDVENGYQPFCNEAGDVHVVFNGEIYNHLPLRRLLEQHSHILRSRCDGEVIAHLYEEYGVECFSMLSGQFAIAICDTRSGLLVLARDPLGICPLHWVETKAGVYFSSEVKGLLTIKASPRQIEPEAILQMGYFGTVCAPLTAFAGVRQLMPAHFQTFHPNEGMKTERYWSLEFPLDGECPAINEREAVQGLQERLENTVTTHMQGESDPTCFLSGGIDSAIIGALLKRGSANKEVYAYCAASTTRKINEGGAAKETAEQLRLELSSVDIDSSQISEMFPDLIRHAETPVISTEAAALMILAGKIRSRSKVVLTGEGADEAFGGYLAFRQNKLLGFLTNQRFRHVRAIVRSLLQRYYGTACLLPGESRLHEVNEHFGCFPAQAYEWEFYREALIPVLSAEYRFLALDGAHWRNFRIDREQLRGRHSLNRSLSVAYQVMLPNYLLGAHGDRIFAANSVEGRYPFLAREIVEYSATLPPGLKIKGFRDKYVLRKAAEKWLPRDIAQRPKRRFVMPFGTPFVGPDAPQIYSDLLSPGTLAEYGYFDPVMVEKVLDGLKRPVSSSRNVAHRYLERLALGLAANFVVSTQLLHYQFIAGHALPDSAGTSRSSVQPGHQHGRPLRNIV